MLETVRAYGLEQLAGAGEEHQVRAAMGRCFLELAESADRLLRGPALADAVVASQRAAERHPGGPVHPVVVMAAPMLAIVQRDYEAALAELSARFGAADPWVGALARMIHAGIAVGLGRVDEAARDVDAAAERFRAVGDGWGAAMTGRDPEPEHHPEGERHRDRDHVPDHVPGHGAGQRRPAGCRSLRACGPGPAGRTRRSPTR